LQQTWLVLNFFLTTETATQHNVTATVLKCAKMLQVRCSTTKLYSHKSVQ